MSTQHEVAPVRILGRTVAVLFGCLGLLASAPPTVGRAEPARWLAPLDPPLIVVRAFDPPAARWLAGHRGVDLAAPEHIPVRAAGAGVVTFAGLVAGRGVVVVGHVAPGGGQLRTTYEPVAATVTTGQAVDTGEPIGSLTVAGGHCRPRACLHWGVLRGNSYLDPLTLLDSPAIRLLPLGPAVLPTPLDTSAGSRPRMSLFVRPPQPLDRHVRVDLRGAQ
jgi:murein DD-endopeptidase MepM/ murein hydrolase activator NlpD